MTQVLASAGDNFLRSALGWSVVAGWSGLDTPLALASGVFAFVLPAIAVSGLAGVWADAGDRGRIALAAQCVGLLGGTAGGAGIWFGSIGLLGVGVLLCGVRAALLGPVKYALIPDLIPEDRLLAANGWVEAGTYVAAVLGAAAGALVVAYPRLAAALAFGGGALGLATGAWFASARPASGGQLAVGRGWLADTAECLALARAGVGVWRCTLALCWFWLVAQGFVAWLPAWTVGDLRASPGTALGLATALALGIALGGGLVNRLSGGWVELGIVPVGTVGISLFGLDLGLFGTHFAPWRAGVDLVGIGLSATLLAVPLHTAVLEWTPAGQRGRVVAAGGALAGLGMAFGALAFAGLSSLGWPIGRIWVALSLVNLGVAAVFYGTAPEFLLRFVAWLLSRVIYRVEVRGAENVPRDGAAVLVSNHVTFVDWLVLMGAIRRPARFVMYKGFFDMPVAGILFRQAGTIPIAGGKEDPEMLERAMDEISATLRRGGLVVIFPEGSLTSDGAIHSFRPGIERIAARDPVSVVPMALNGLWGSFFSRYRGKPFRRPFSRGFRSPVWVTLAPPVPPGQVTAAALQEQVTALWGRRSEA